MRLLDVTGLRGGYAAADEIVKAGLELLGVPVSHREVVQIRQLLDSQGILLYVWIP